MNVVPIHHYSYTVSSPRVAPTNTFEPFSGGSVNSSITTRFEAQVARNPDCLAVYVHGKQFTYDQLNGAANQIARTVISNLGERDEAVGLFMEQGGPAIAAILGILKAGKFYVPLNSAFSSMQNASIVEDARVALILCDSKHLPLCEGLGVQVLNLDEQPPAGPSTNLDLPIPPATTAYTLYTSGSTGRPKAVVQTHRNVLHNVMNYTNGLHINSDDKLTLLSSISFGASVSDIFGALLNGAALYPFDLKAEGFQSLSRLMQEEGITIYHSVPSVYRNFLSTLTGNDSFPKLRIIKLGGESVTVKDVELYKGHFGRDCLLHVGLGSTEVNIIRQYFIDHDTGISGPLVPVGYGVPGTDVILLDEMNDPVAPGTPGEIAVGSEYLPVGKGNLYRTGDMGLMQPDGCLYHLGRKDFQVKIRGYRVELSEIESALKEFPGITEAAVSGIPVATGEKVLVAHLVAAPHVDTAHIRGFLRETIAEYMVPSRYVFLDALPMTPNGKIDRLALLNLEDSRSRAAAHEDASLGSPTEQKLATIWKELLCVNTVGCADNFFHLGGDSLTSLILVARISSDLKVDLPGNIVYEHPTIAGLASVIEMTPGRGSVDSRRSRVLIPVSHGNSADPPIFIVPGGRGGMDAPVTSNTLIKHLAPDLSAYALVPRSADGKTPGHESVIDMASEYIEEIQRVQPTGPYFIIGGCIGSSVAFEMARQLENSGETVALLALIDGRYTTASRWITGSLYNFATSMYVRQFPAQIGQRVRQAAKALSRLPLRYRMSYLRRLGQTIAEEIEATFHDRTPDLVLTKMQRFQFQYRRTLRRYRPGHFSGDLKLILSDEFAEKPTIKEWRRVVGGRVQAEFVPGSHRGMLQHCAFKTAALIKEFYRQALADLRE